MIWLRLRHGGKAHALNAALMATECDVVLTVDADTVPDSGPSALCDRPFPANRSLPVSPGSSRRSAGPRHRAGTAVVPDLRVHPQFPRPLRVDARRLPGADIGAFSGFRRRAVIDVGGFDDVCLVEDYELVHRMRRYAGEHGLVWRFRVLGDAQARTEAPGSVAALLRQRRRWFGGFLQTQWWYRAMVGDQRMGRLGTLMLRSRPSTRCSRSTV